MRNLAGGVIKVTKVARVGRAAPDTGWLQSLLQAVRAKVTLLYGGSLVSFNSSLLIGSRCLREILGILGFTPVESGAIGAGHHTGSAADAQVLVYENDAILTLLARPGRTNIHTWWLFTVVAEHRQGSYPG